MLGKRGRVGPEVGRMWGAPAAGLRGPGWSQDPPHLWGKELVSKLLAPGPSRCQRSHRSGKLPRRGPESLPALACSCPVNRVTQVTLPSFPPLWGRDPCTVNLGLFSGTGFGSSVGTTCRSARRRARGWVERPRAEGETGWHPGACPALACHHERQPRGPGSSEHMHGADVDPDELLLAAGHSWGVICCAVSL